MEFEEVYYAINSIHPITDEAWQDFSDLLESIELKRNDYLIRQGNLVHHCYMLTEGVVRVFYSKEGNEYNKTFFIPGMFPTPLTALLSKKPCHISFQALNECELLKFSYKEFRALFNKHRCLEQMMLSILEREWIAKEEHDIHMVTNDATTNYELFKKKYPDLENLIPQYHIASYLGVTPIQLSRIRAQLSKS